MLSTSVVVLDFETTGFSPSAGDRITEVAALRLKGDRVVERYVTLVNAGVPIPERVREKTRISNQMLVGAPTPETVLRQLVAFLGGDIIVAHNASFDLKFLRYERLRTGLGAGNHRSACTIQLSRQLLPGLANYKLATVADALSVRFTGDAHRAEADAAVTAGIVVELTTRLVKQFGLPSIHPDLLCQITAEGIDGLLVNTSARQTTPR